MKELTKEQVKEIKTEIQSNHLIITIGYSFQLVLPFKEGMKVIESLEKAELLEDGYSDKGYIVSIPVEESRLAIKAMSHKEYIGRKTAQVFGVSYKEFIEAEKQNEQKSGNTRSTT